jgi:hypothetical protein
MVCLVFVENQTEEQRSIKPLLGIYGTEGVDANLRNGVSSRRVGLRQIENK